MFVICAISTSRAAISTDVQVPVFASEGPPSYRDPVDFLEARSVDYSRLPSSIGQARIRGLLTPGMGTLHAPGRFIARISDNDDGDNDLLTDVDNKFFIRVAGIVPGPPQEVLQYGSLQKNAVAMIEAFFKRDMSLDVGSPFTVYGPDANPARNNFFDGNSFTLDGYDHSGMTDRRDRASQPPPQQRRPPKPDCPFSTTLPPRETARTP